MPYRNVLFAGFEGRFKELRKVKRWNTFDFMIYRTNLEDHHEMVVWAVQEILSDVRKVFPIYADPLQEARTLTLGMIHDDLETVMKRGDLSAFLKWKMTPAEQKELEDEEVRAVEDLAAKYPATLNGFCYRDLLYESMRKRSIASQVVSYADKAVGFGEALHELYAGNKSFILDEKENNSPALSYVERLRAKEKWPLLGPLFACDHPFFSVDPNMDPEKIAENGSLHTTSSIVQPTENKFYNCWREMVMKRGGERGLELLLKQRELC